jgi:phosphoribosylformylglycinamidine cyclo-ligase
MPTKGKSAYAEAGVDIDAQEKALGKIKKLVRSTSTDGVLSELGNFGGLFRPAIEGMTEPVLVASADGVGTKLRVARLADDFSTVGQDLVNHCVNDILAQGARPLFFMDYVGAGVLGAKEVVDLVSGVAAACRENGCALLGGEMAEMPGFYDPGDYELVGFIVGMVDRPAILDGSRVRPHDLLIGLPSSGLHTNGYSLVRRIVFDKLGLSVSDRFPGTEIEGRVGEVLLTPHRTYLPAVVPLLDHPGLHAVAHITGGGLTDNVPRVLPPKTRAEIRVGTWRIPEIFHFLQEQGGITTEEMFRVFNMGVGLVLVIDPESAAEILAILRDAGQRAFPMGTVQEGGSGVVYDLGSSGAAQQ